MPSIYRPNDPPGTPAGGTGSGSHVDTEAPSVREAAPGEPSEWAGRRKAQPVNVLLPATRRWLESIPIEGRPVALADQFPRLANLIAANWDNPGDCSAFIYSLLHDKRGGRRGFPDDVARDILRLRVYYARLHPIVNWEPDGGANYQRSLWKPAAPKR